MIRAAVVSRSDQFRRDLRRAAERSGLVRLDLQLHSAAELRSASHLDVVILHQAASEVEAVQAVAGTVPIVLAGGDQDDGEGAIPGGETLLELQDGWALVPDHDPEQVVAAAVAAAYRLAVRAADAGTDSDGVRGAPLPNGAAPELLTARETDVLQLAAAGRSNRQIADQLGISGNTVKYHIASLYAKLGVSRRSELVFAAIRRGLVTI